jgi:hypothetical protein
MDGGVHRRRNRQYENNKVQAIKHLMNQNQTRKFYAEINTLQKMTNLS